MSTIDFLVKLRDALQMAAEAVDEYLESMVPLEVRDWNPENIKWQQAQGPSGPYERADPKENVGNPDFEALIADLDQHNGKLTKQNWFYWKFTNGDFVGRKRRS